MWTGHAGMLVEEWHPEPSSSSIASGHRVLAIAFSTAARSRGARQLPGLTGREGGGGKAAQVPGTTAASIYLYTLPLTSSFPAPQLLLPPCTCLGSAVDHSHPAECGAALLLDLLVGQAHTGAILALRRRAGVMCFLTNTSSTEVLGRAVVWQAERAGEGRCYCLPPTRQG